MEPEEWRYKSEGRGRTNSLRESFGLNNCIANWLDEFASVFAKTCSRYVQTYKMPISSRTTLVCTASRPADAMGTGESNDNDDQRLYEMYKA